MGNFTQTQIDNVWAKAQIVPNNDKWRKDICGAWIYEDSHGKTSEGGWEVDHQKPIAKGGSDALSNLRPMHWENNRSKGSDYPSYNAAITSEGNENVETNQSYKIG